MNCGGGGLHYYDAAEIFSDSNPVCDFLRTQDARELGDVVRVRERFWLQASQLPQINQEIGL